MTAASTRSLVPVFVTVLVWEGTARALSLAVFPPFSRVMSALARMVESGQIFGSLAASLSTLAVGFGLAIVIGVGVGALMGVSLRLERVLEPYLHAGLASPMLIFVPVLLALTGPTRWTQVATVFLYSVFVIASHMLAGMHGASRRTIEMAHAFGATRWQTLTLVVLPGARPMVLSGLRVSVALAVKGMVNGEMLTASVGLGALVRAHGGRFEVENVLALLVVIVGITVSATWMLQNLERRALGPRAGA